MWQRTSNGRETNISKKDLSRHTEDADVYMYVHIYIIIFIRKTTRDERVKGKRMKTRRRSAR